LKLIESFFKKRHEKMNKKKRTRIKFEKLKYENSRLKGAIMNHRGGERKEKEKIMINKLYEKDYFTPKLNFLT
jgi:hypothetical protein